MSMGNFSVFEWKRAEIKFVAVILVVLLGISYAQLIIGQMKTRDAQRRGDVNLVAKALDRYTKDHGSPPPATDGKIVGCGDKGIDLCEWGGGPVQDSEGVGYLNKIPVDPLAYKGWKYVYETDGTKFRVYVAWEYPRGLEVKPGLTAECGSGVQCKWYAGN